MGLSHLLIHPETSLASHAHACILKWNGDIRPIISKTGKNRSDPDNFVTLLVEAQAIYVFSGCRDVTASASFGVQAEVLAAISSCVIMDALLPAAVSQYCKGLEWSKTQLLISERLLQ